jgi:hypothetical protein
MMTVRIYFRDLSGAWYYRPADIQFSETYGLLAYVTSI